MKHLFIICVCLYSFLFANQNVGLITAINGKVTIQRDSKIIDTYLGFYIFKNDIIKTGDKSRVQIVFKDKTIISLGENSEFSIEDYFYDEESKEEPKASFKFINGVFKSITGKIGKINPDNFKLKTKSASIGIRGTTFFGTINNENEEDIACTQGKIIVDTNQGKIDIPAGRFSAVEKNKIPTRPEIITPEKLLELEKTSGAFDNERESGFKQKKPTILEQKIPILKKGKVKEKKFVINNSINISAVYDNNINKSFNPNVILDNDLEREQDLYIGLRMKNEILIPYKQNEKFDAILSLETTIKDYNKFNDYDLLYLELNAGLKYNSINATNITALELENIWLNTKQSMYLYGISNDFQYNLKDKYKVLSHLDYKEKKLIKNLNNDANTKIKKANFGLEIPLANVKEKIIVSTAIEGYRKENTSYLNINRDVYQAQLFYKTAITSSYLLESSITYKKINYLDKYQDSKNRKDTQHSFFLNIIKNIDVNKQAILSYEYNKNNSDIQMYSYSKNTISLYLKMLF